MTGTAGSLLRRLRAFPVFAYRSLVLCFLFIAAMRLAFHDGGWINDLIVSLALAVPLVLAPAYRSLRRERS